MKFLLTYIHIIEEENHLSQAVWSSPQKNLLYEFAKENSEFIFTDFDNYSATWLVQQTLQFIQQSDAFAVFILNKQKAKLERIIPFFNSVLKLKQNKLFLSQGHNPLIDKMLSILPEGSHLPQVENQAIKPYLDRFKIDFLGEKYNKN